MLAFKEWSYIVTALGKGKQSIILRKGGISEENGDFELKGKEFILFPTLYHQAEQLIKPQWLPFLKTEQYHIESGKVRIKYFAKVLDSQVLTDWGKVKKLDAFHGWKEEIIQERFWRWENKIQLLVLQIYELGAAQDIVLKPEYEGCKSWIEIDEKIELRGRPIVNRNII
ncbi:MAG: hypothetical protein JWO58_268 [Chitinophagaceae bacterium]|nr:hypothetical protein [Chitinophagaceae bacterium]